MIRHSVQVSRTDLEWSRESLPPAQDRNKGDKQRLHYSPRYASFTRWSFNSELALSLIVMTPVSMT